MEENLEIDILIDCSSIEASEGLFGDITIRYREIFFPTRNWNDFLVLLAEWAEKLIAFEKGEPVVDLYFIDGPYRVRLSRHGCNSYVQFYFENYPILSGVKGTRVAYYYFKQSVYKAISRVIEGHSMGLYQIDGETTRQEVESFEQAIQVLS